MRSAVIAAVVVAFAAGEPAAAQQRNGALQAEPSGRARTAVSFRRGGAGAPLTVAIEYGQPHARGRAIVGGVVPFDRVWRTGANAATSFTTDVDLTVGGARVPRGRYTLYTLPTRAGWKLIINRQTGQWGTVYDAAQDLARIPMRAEAATAGGPELFTIAVEPTGANAGALRLTWGDINVSVPVTAKN